MPAFCFFIAFAAKCRKGDLRFEDGLSSVEECSIPTFQLCPVGPCGSLENASGGLVTLWMTEAPYAGLLMKIVVFSKPLPVSIRKPHFFTESF